MLYDPMKDLSLSFLDKLETKPNTICPKCHGTFDCSTVKIKRYDPYEGTEIFVFDCPCCGEEIHDMECDYIEE